MGWKKGGERGRRLGGRREDVYNYKVTIGRREGVKDW